jgi:hypothetical protein
VQYTFYTYSSVYTFYKHCKSACIHNVVNIKGDCGYMGTKDVFNRTQSIYLYSAFIGSISVDIKPYLRLWCNIVTTLCIQADLQCL